MHQQKQILYLYQIIKVNDLKYAINHEEIPSHILREQFPIPAIVVSFPNYIFSRSLNMLELEK